MLVGMNQLFLSRPFVFSEHAGAITSVLSIGGKAAAASTTAAAASSKDDQQLQKVSRQNRKDGVVVVSTDADGKIVWWKDADNAEEDDVVDDADEMVGRNIKGSRAGSASTSTIAEYEEYENRRRAEVVTSTCYFNAL